MRGYRQHAAIRYQQAGEPAELNGIDRQRLLSALILLVIALFVASGLPPAVRWRRSVRLAAIGGFLVAVVLALAEIAVWWTGPGR